MNTKKKIVLISSVVIILAMLAVGGSLAWFSDTDSATNVFTVGSVKIVQNEEQFVLDAEGNKTTEKEAFADDKVLMPVVNVQNPEADENYLDKIVTVTSTGANPAYVRTHIAIPTKLVGTLKLQLSDSDKCVKADTTETTTVGGVEYTVYSFTYTDALTEDQTTEDLLLGVYIDAKTDLKDNPETTEADMEFCYFDETEQKYVFTGYVAWTADGTASEKVNVLVATQACQSQGFTDAQTALDTVFTSIPDFTKVNP